VACAKRRGPTPRHPEPGRETRQRRWYWRATLRLLRYFPDGATRVSESGIETADDVRRLHAAGVHALLVGETLMRAADPVALVREWMDASR
jgi:indole-3-glycerol phosphate synthase